MANGARGEPAEPNDVISQGIQTKKTCTEYKCSKRELWCKSKDCEQFKIMKGLYEQGDERLQQPKNRSWHRFFLRRDLNEQKDCHQRLQHDFRKNKTRATQQKIKATQQTIERLQAKFDAPSKTVESSKSDAPDHVQTGQQQKNQDEKPDQNGKALSARPSEPSEPSAESTPEAMAVVAAVVVCPPPPRRCATRPLPPGDGENKK